MCKVVLVLVWLKEVKEMVVVTVVTDCRQCLERLVSKVVDLGWMDKHLKQVICPQQQPQQQQAKCVTECTRDLRARQTWMQVVKGIRCRDVNKETCP